VRTAHLIEDAGAGVADDFVLVSGEGNDEGVATEIVSARRTGRRAHVEITHGTGIERICTARLGKCACPAVTNEFRLARHKRTAVQSVDAGRADAIAQAKIGPGSHRHGPVRLAYRAAASRW